jgi:hypothetical protein
MMDFSMRYCKKIRTLAFLGCLLMLAIASSAWAASGKLEIKTAELVAVEEAYLLNADLELNFSPEVEEAINKGVPLNFLIEFQVVSLRQYWFDDEIVSVSQRVGLSYHALSRQYLINSANHQKTFATLEEAKEEFSHLRDWVVLGKSLLKKGESYQAALRVRLDQSRLPKPLQVDALSSEAWNLVSQRYRWTPSFAL